MRLDGTIYKAGDSDGIQKTQLDIVREIMEKGTWMTPQQISMIGKIPEGSVTSRIRDLRLPRHGGHDIKKRFRGDPKLRITEYRMTPKITDFQLPAFGDEHESH